MARALLIFMGILLLGLVDSFFAQDQKDHAEDEKAIRANIDAYIDAYRKGDAEAVAGFWSETGRYNDPSTGEAIIGREALKASFASQFESREGQEVDIELEVISLRFPVDRVAIEDGYVWVIRGKQVSAAEYTVVHIKNDKGIWKIDSIRETPLESIQNNTAGSRKELSPLAWLVGNWSVETGDKRITTSCEWAMQGRFLRRTFKVFEGNQEVMSGIEVIGWDADEKRIRSWVFDSEGGHAEVSWSIDEKTGTITRRAKATLADGKEAYATFFFSRVDDDHYKWRVVGRELEGVPQPNIDSIIFTRQNDEP